MGNSYTVEANQDSPVNPGTKVVLTSALEGVSPEDLADGTQDLLKNPVPPFLAPVLKEVKVDQLSDKSFEVKVILDGKKLDDAGYGNSGKDKVSRWLKVEWHDTEMLIQTLSYVPPDGAWIEEASNDKVYAETYTRFISEPTRIEYWWVVDGQRSAGDTEAEHLKGYLQILFEICKPRKVRFNFDCDSIYEPGLKSIISEPMDDHLTFDKLWEAFLDHKAIYAQVPGFESMEIQEVSETEVIVTGENGVEPAGGSITVSWNKDEGKVARVRKIAGKTTESEVSVATQNPLRMEVWRVDADGKRISNKTLAKFHSYLMDQLIEKLQKASSWF